MGLGYETGQSIIRYWLTFDWKIDLSYLRYLCEYLYLYLGNPLYSNLLQIIQFYGKRHWLFLGDLNWTSSRKIKCKEYLITTLSGMLFTCLGYFFCTPQKKVLYYVRFNFGWKICWHPHENIQIFNPW